VFFYVLFPMLLKGMSRLSLSQLAGLALATWLAALAAAGAYVRLRPDGLAITPWVMPDGYFWLQALKFNPLVRLPEFIAGMACGLWFLRGGHRSSRSMLLVAGGAALLAGFLAVSSRIPYPILHTGLTAPAFAALICGLALRPAWSAFSHSKLCTLLGESSYCLYLLHPFVVGMVLFVPLSKVAPGGQPVPGPGRAITAILVASWVGVLAFRYMEEPLRRRLRFGTPKS